MAKGSGAIARNILTFLSFSLILTVGPGVTDLSARPGDKVIYGDDDRRDLYEASNSAKMVELAQSTAALVRREDVSTDSANPSLKRLPNQPFGESFGLCKDEPFFTQPNPAFCSGFLVGKDVFVTAGHCLRGPQDCEGTALVFGFAYDTPSRDASIVHGEDVYLCKQIISRKEDRETQSDFAVIRLDRPVTGREPLKFRTKGQVGVGDALTVIGHPSGLPTKIAGGAMVRSIEPKTYFIANLDTYGGNSGSAVFNTTTGEVEGVLVRGEEDFDTRDGCRISKRCAMDACRGEDVTRASEFVPYLPSDGPDRPHHLEQAEFANIGLAIPDANPTGVIHEMPVKVAGVIGDIAVHVKITHSMIGDLVLELIHPDGTVAVLQNKQGGRARNMDQVFGMDGMLVDSLMDLKGKPIAGTYKLQVRDVANGDVGTLDYVKLTFKIYDEGHEVAAVE